MNNEFDLILKSFRDNKTNIVELVEWVKSNSKAISNLITRTAFLAIKRGDPTKALLERLSNNCSCQNIYKAGGFKSYPEFEYCMIEVDHSKISGKLKSTKEPVWSIQNKAEIGAAGFYQCIDCRAIWKVLAPERSSNGSWNRIA